MDEQELIDTIYEAAFLPDFWPTILDELANMAEAAGGVIFSTNAAHDTFKWMASQELRESFARFIAGGWLTRDTRLGRILATGNPGFLTEHDIFSPEDLAKDPTFHGFRVPEGLGWGAGIAVPLPTGDAFGIGVERRYARGPIEPAYIEKLERYRPHLARSALMSTRLQMERMRSATETLALVGLPALALAENGAVIVANKLIEALSGPITWRARNRVALVDPRAQDILQQALAALDADDGPTAGTRSFTLRATGESPAMVAHLVPVRRAARDIFAVSAGVLILTPVTAAQAPPVELVRSLFDLTPAETRVARAIAAGGSVEDIAAAANLSVNTIRSQLNRVFMKTGCTRQGELVALLGGIGRTGVQSE